MCEEAVRTDEVNDGQGRDLYGGEEAEGCDRAAADESSGRDPTNQTIMKGNREEKET